MGAAPRAVPVGPLRAVLYLRQSVAREESISLELQETAGREYCARHGYTVVAVESDPGISGRTWKRPAVQRVMTMIESRGADVIVLWKWSRLSRSRLDWAVAADRVETAGGRIESATEPIDTSTSTGCLARGMLTEFAAFESERIGDVWKEAHQRRRRNGLPAQGGDRFGYLRDGNTYTPDPETGPFLATMYRRYLSGDGFTRIVAWLNASGVETKTGGPWDRSRVTRILDSGFGAGQIIHGRGRQATYYPGAHPAVITQREWEQYREAREDAPPPPRTVEPVYFLSGLIRCGDCGAPMHASSNGGPGRGYTCSRWSRTKSVRCVTALRERAEACVVEWLHELAADMDGLVEAAKQVQQQRVVAIADTAAIDRRLEAVERQMVQLTRGYTSERVPEFAYQATMTSLQSERESLLARRAVAESTGQGVELRARQQVRDLVEVWEAMTTSERRTALSKLIREVRVFPPPEHRRGSVTFDVVPRWAAL